MNVPQWIPLVLHVKSIFHSFLSGRSEKPVWIVALRPGFGRSKTFHDDYKRLEAKPFSSSLPD